MFKTINIFRITSGLNQEPDTGTMDDVADAMLKAREEGGAA